MATPIPHALVSTQLIPQLNLGIGIVAAPQRILLTRTST